MDIRPTRRRLLGMVGAALTSTALPVAPAHSRSRKPRIIELAVAGGRISQITHWRAASPRGTILFSHGALSSPAKYDPLILPWVAAGYDVWAPLHVDSTDHPDTRSYTGFMSWRARIEDMRALSDHIGTGPRIAAGHSYGALVALTLGGAAAEIPDGLSGPLADRQVTAVVAFSPPGPTKGLISRDGYATLAVPALIETGTRDVPPTRPGGTAPDPDSWHSHLIAYDAAAPGGDRYALVLDGVNHFFGGLICWLDQPGPPQLWQMGVAGEISQLFLDAYGQGSGVARQMLDARLSENLPVMLSRK